MSHLDTETYRKLVLRPVEDCLLSSREEIEGFTSQNLYQAIRTELTRADTETGLIEASDNLCSAIDEAARRILDNMEHNRDLGFGASS